MQTLPLYPVSQTKVGALVGALAAPAAANPTVPKLDLSELPSPPPARPRPR